MERRKTILADCLGILPATPEANLLRLLIQTGAQVIGAEEGSLLVLDEKANNLYFAMTVTSKDYENREIEEQLLGQRVPLGKGITGLAASTHEVQIGSPSHRDFQFTEADEGEPEAVLAAPMLIGDTLIGVITAVSFVKGKRFTSQDALLYGRFASMAGVIVDQNRRLVSWARAFSGGGASPKVFGKTGQLEQRIVDSIGKIIKKSPQSLQHVAQLFEDIEKIINPERDMSQ